MNTNIEELYKKKYLKYKAKYLNIQRGGRFTQGRNHPNHIAFKDKDKLLKEIKVGGPAGFMALDDEGNIAVVTNVNSVKIINLENNNVVNTYTSTTYQPVSGIAFDSNNFYIGNARFIDYHAYHARTYHKGELEVPMVCRMLACNKEYVYILTGTKIYVYTKPSFSSPSRQILVINNQELNYIPASMAFDREGQIVVADVGNNRIQVIPKIEIDPTRTNEISLNSLDKSKFRYIGREGSGPGQFNKPTDFAFNVHGQIIVADTENNRVQILDYKTGMPWSQFKIDKPVGIVVDGNGRILVSTGNTIQALDRSEFDLFPAPKPYFIITSKINIYLDYLRKYDPYISVVTIPKPTFVSSYAIILRVDTINEQQKKELMEFLKSRFDQFKIEIDPLTQDIKISSTTIPLEKDDDHFLSKLTVRFSSIVYKSENIYKHTVMTTAEYALRYYLTEGLRLTPNDAKKQQTFKVMLEENKLERLETKPPLPSK